MNIKTMILFCKNITLYCALKCMNSSALSYSQILLNDEDELPAWYPWEGPARATQASPEGETGINVFCERVMSINFVPPPGADVHSERHSVQTLNIKRLLSQSSHPSISGILSRTCNIVTETESVWLKQLVSEPKMIQSLPCSLEWWRREVYTALEPRIIHNTNTNISLYYGQDE